MAMGNFLAAQGISIPICHGEIFTNFFGPGATAYQVVGLVIFGWPTFHRKFFCFPCRSGPSYSGIFGLACTVRIDNSLPLETWAQGQDLNPEPEFLQAAGPMDREPVCPHFSEIEPPQAEAPAKS
ncbi:hypothetical protein DSO57_1031651 [Entomophthora muscae]|uniref:Uncharacterized protein n=1 Tax=Entomophthora muscae TaxID=34485 RepID=A0ACC2RRJ0_9FUNG|nr:hypothetical protein DSO57_1031651 [Entomophthora muscae]